MNIAVAVNQKFLKYLYVMLTSLLENNKTANITIYLLSADLNESQVKVIRELVETYGQNFCFLKIERGRFPKELPFSEKITVETYFRLMLPELLPEELERVLYLDVDLIINKPLDALYGIDFENKCFVGCRDVTSTAMQHVQQSELFADLLKNPGFIYFNAGVLLFNLKKLRKVTSFESLMEEALKIKEKLVYHDQDLLNYVFWNEVKYVEPEEFNLAARTAYNSGIGISQVEEYTTILHYAGPKPWHHEEVRYELESFWWEYAKKTPFYVELLEEMVLSEIHTGYMDQLFRALKQENDELRQIVDKCMTLLKLKAGE